MIDANKVGIKIAQYRSKMHLTQDDLAKQLFVTRQAVSKWENGISLPSIDIVIELASLFKINYDDLLCLDEKNDIDPKNLFLSSTKRSCYFTNFKRRTRREYC